jgi:hypothetical protein
MIGGLEKGSLDSSQNGKIDRTGTNIVRKDNSSDEKRKRSMSGFLRKARGNKWSISA